MADPAVVLLEGGWVGEPGHTIERRLGGDGSCLEPGERRARGGSFKQSLCCRAAELPAGRLWAAVRVEAASRGLGFC